MVVEDMTLCHKHRQMMQQSTGVTQVETLSATLLETVRSNLIAAGQDPDSMDVEEMTRLCWRNEPFRHLDC